MTTLAKKALMAGLLGVLALGGCSKETVVSPLPAPFFTPTPTATPTNKKLMLVGDSIGSGFTPSTPGYAQTVCESISNANYSNVQLVGANSGNFTGTDYTGLVTPFCSSLRHQCQYGWTVDQILAGNTGSPSDGYLSQWLTAQNPDIVVAVVGTNDALFQTTETASQTVSEIGTLVDQCRAYNPNMKICLAKIPPTLWDPSTRINDINQLIPSLAASKNTVQSPVTYVDLNTYFNPSNSTPLTLTSPVTVIPPETVDNLHPNLNGANDLGQRIFNILKNSNFIP